MAADTGDLDTESGKAGCTVDGGCSYLRTLAIIEHLAGFDVTAARLSGVAAECQNRGCSALRWQTQQPASPGRRHPIPFPLQRARPPRPQGDQRVAGADEAVALSRAESLDRISDAAGNYVEHRALKLGDLKRSDSLDNFFQYWRWLRGAAQCEFSNIDTVHLMRSGVIGKLHIVDVSSADPNDFRFELVAYSVPLAYYEKPRAYPIEIYADCTLRDYNTVRMTGVPRLQRVRARLGGVGAHYTRLILPFWDKRGRVARLAVAIHREPGDGIRHDT